MDVTERSLDPLFEPSGLEPELPGADQNEAPMLGGSRRQWPSLAAYLLGEQHRAQRACDMVRVWAIRRLRARIQRRFHEARVRSYQLGEAVRPPTDEDALSEIVAERDEAAEELEEVRKWGNLRRLDDCARTLQVIEDVVTFWQPHLDTGAQNHYR